MIVAVKLSHWTVVECYNLPGLSDEIRAESLICFMAVTFYSPFIIVICWLNVLLDHLPVSNLLMLLATDAMSTHSWYSPSFTSFRFYVDRELMLFLLIMQIVNGCVHCFEKLCLLLQFYWVGWIKRNLFVVVTARHLYATDACNGALRW